MRRTLPRLALVLLALAACRPHGAVEAPGPRRERARARAGREPAVLDLAVAGSRTCAVLAGGELRCWGGNEHGRLGDGTERTRRYPHPVHGMTDAVQVALGLAHACARHRDGRVSCWGLGTEGQLGDGTREDRRTPVPVKGLVDAVDVGVGRSHSCAVKADGSAWCWGSNDTGELGDGTRRPQAAPVRVEGLPRARLVRAGGGFTCALLRDDSVWCWGSDVDGLTGRPEPAPRCGESEHSPPCLPTPAAAVPLPPVAALEVGDQHACALGRDGEVRCWGSTFACEHGVSELERVRAPRAIAGLPPIAALAGPQCVHTRTGVLVCWGRNPAVPDLDYGYDLAAPAYACSMTRVPAELTRGASLVAAHEHGGCALRDAAKPGAQAALWCWGDNGSGQLGDGSEVSRPAGVEVTALRRAPAPDGPTPLHETTLALVRAGVPDHGHALVWHDARVYPDATTARPVGSIADYPAELRGDRHGGLLPVRIVATHGERLEVEPLGRGEASRHCAGGSFVGFDRYAVRMFVHVADLAPVIAREYAMGYPDGSGVTLGPGVAVRPLEAGMVVRMGGLVLPLELAEGDVGLAYDTAGLPSSAGARWWELPRLSPRAVLTLDERRVYVGELPEHLDRVHWTKPEEAGVERVHTEDGCVALDLIADAPVPTDDRGSGAGSLGGTELVEHTVVREGAPAYWPGGAAAGRARASYRTRQPLRPDGARRCLPLAGELLVCHDAADLSTETFEVSRWSSDEQ